MTRLDQLQVFFGQASSASARVYARLDAAQDITDLTLEGTVRGPYCTHARTLPASYALQDRGGHPRPLAAAVIPDPCFWSPGLPHLYQVQVQLCRHDCVLESAEYELGIRPLGVRGRDLFFDAKRWVLRGVARDDVESAELPDWRENAAAMMVVNPGEALCRDASREGVLLVAWLCEHGEPLRQRLRSIARWPAVGIAVLGEEPDDPAGLQDAAPNVLLAQSSCVADAQPPAPWAQVAVAEIDSPPEKLVVEQLIGGSVPVLAIRRLAERVSLVRARAACDHLQRDLAPHGDLAGYIV